MNVVSRPTFGLSLCAGGGGLDMGLGLAEPGFATAAYVEWEAYPRATLVAAQRAGYLHPAPIWGDVTAFDARPWRGIVDTVLAGYPCQPFSQAGQRRGADDERHLWPDVARIIEQCRPRWVFLENVAGHVSLGAETVLRDLWDMGWTPAAGLFSAGETGAAHERLRWFCVAYRSLNGCERRTQRDGAAKAQGSPQLRNHIEGCDLELAHPHGGHAGAERQQRGGEQRLHAAGRGTGACNVGDSARLGRREGRAEHEFRSGGDTAAGTSSAMDQTAGDDAAVASEPGPQGRERTGSPDERDRPTAPRPAAEFRRAFLHAPGPADLDKWSAVLSVAPGLAPAVSLRDVKRAADHFAALVAAGELAETAAKSLVRGMVASLSTRTRSLRLLGNAVHPLTAALAWRTLASAHGLESIKHEDAS